MTFRPGRWVVAALALLSIGVGSRPDLLARRVNQLAAPDTWSALGWEARYLPAGLGLVVAQVVRPPPQPDPRLVGFLHGELPRTEDDRRQLSLSLAAAVAAELRARGVASLDGLVLPPVSLALTEPPQSLIISPRTEIRTAQWVLLDGTLDVAGAEALERTIERLDVSALVVQIGGISTYPVLVPPDAPPAWVLQTVAHEWTHTALFASSLGRAYGSSPDARAINETTADLVGSEVAAAIAPTVEAEAAPAPDSDRTRVLRDALRRIRQGTDERLAAGDVAGAEAYMETEREELVARGYRIRRINQAYFAFYGNYAEGPAPSTEIVDDLRELRTRSASLGDFLERVGRITSVEELRVASGR